jgi:hypothetical protein
MMKFYIKILGLILILTAITSCSSTPSRSEVSYQGYRYAFSSELGCVNFKEIYAGRIVCADENYKPIRYIDAMTDQQVRAYNKSESNDQVSTIEGIGYLLQSFADGFNSNSNSNSYTPSFDSYTPSFDSNSSSGYNTSFGNTYQYNLQNPVDRVRYNSDPSARLRDRVTPNPYKNIERNTLQRGGGIYQKSNVPTWNWVR